jgi:hypothetical protein
MRFGALSDVGRVKSFNELSSTCVPVVKLHERRPEKTEWQARRQAIFGAFSRVGNFGSFGSVGSFGAFGSFGNLGLPRHPSSQTDTCRTDGR